MGIGIGSNKINILQNSNTAINKSEKANNSNDKNTKNNSNIKFNQNKNKNQSGLMDKLLQQKAALIKEKQSIMTKNMDANMRKSELEDINEKIQEVDAQIQQLNMQEKQEEIEKKQEELEKKHAKEKQYNQNGDEIQDDIIVSASLNELIKYNSSKESIHRLKDSKNRQKIESMYIKPSEKTDSYDNKRLTQISKNIASIDMSINNKIRDLNKSAHKINYKTEIAIENLREKKSKELETQKKSADNKHNTTDEAQSNTDNTQDK